MTFAKTERAALCAELLRAGPDAPTLCKGWTTHDLAAHLWIRETDPLGAPGMFVRPLAGLTERRMAELKTRLPYPELVARFAKGPATASVYAIPGLDDAANSIEFFVHLEDVRRAGAEPQPPRDLPLEVERMMWKRLRLLARALFRRSPVGIALEWPGDEPDTIRALRGTSTVTLSGQPSELVLYAYGRIPAAHVERIGDPADIAALEETDFSA